MERSTIQLLAKRGMSQREIAKQLGRNRRTIARVLDEPVDQQPRRRVRRSNVDPFRPHITRWLAEGLTVVRMLELARSDPHHPYTGGHSVFGDVVRRMRHDLQHEQAVRAVPLRFEGLPGEYLQVDWGEVRQFPFLQHPKATRYFLACRLKYSRWSWVRFTTDMRQEMLFRGIVDCFVALGWVPWVLVFDNMKTVTSGRDAAHQPLWTPALLQLAGEFGFHPQACDPGAGNQKGSVESLVKWVKGNFLSGRRFTDDHDLATQLTDWLAQANSRPSAATDEPPLLRLQAEAARGGALPSTAQDYGLPSPGLVSTEALVAVAGNRYSVPVIHVGAPVTIRLHPHHVCIWRDMLCLADHPRAPDGAHRRVVDAAHFAALFPKKPRAQAMLYREVLLALAAPAPAFLAELSYRHRRNLAVELRAVYALYEQYGEAELLVAMELAQCAGSYSAAALAVLLAPSQLRLSLPPLDVPGVPRQTEVDRLLSVYEQWVEIDVALPEVDA